MKSLPRNRNRSRNRNQPAGQSSVVSGQSKILVQVLPKPGTQCDNLDQLKVTIAMEVLRELAGNGPWKKFAASAEQSWQRLLPFTKGARP